MYEVWSARRLLQAPRGHGRNFSLSSLDLGFSACDPPSAPSHVFLVHGERNAPPRQAGGPLWVPVLVRAKTHNHHHHHHEAGAGWLAGGGPIKIRTAPLPETCTQEPGVGCAHAEASLLARRQALTKASVHRTRRSSVLARNIHVRRGSSCMIGLNVSP